LAFFGLVRHGFSIFVSPPPDHLPDFGP